MKNATVTSAVEILLAELAAQNELTPRVLDSIQRTARDLELKVNYQRVERYERAMREQQAQ